MAFQETMFPTFIDMVKLGYSRPLLHMQGKKVSSWV